MKSKPQVSIVIPCYNHGHYLDGCVDSVLAQTYKNIEIIIVNDGSTDEKTISILKDFKKDKTRIINKKNEGLAQARNTGIADSRGAYILPLDADDLIEPNHIEALMQAHLASQNAELGVAYTGIHVFGDIDEQWGSGKDITLLSQLAFNNLPYCSLYKREVFEDVKKANGFGYNPNMKEGYEDWDYWISALEAGWGFVYLEQYSFKYRRSGNSMVDKARENNANLVKQIISNHKKSYLENYDEVLPKVQDRIVNMHGWLIGKSKQIASLDQKIDRFTVTRENLEELLSKQKKQIVQLKTESNELSKENEMLIYSTKSFKWLIKRFIINVLDRTGLLKREI